MGNMDDLIGELTRNVHVSQEGYELKALQVSHHIVILEDKSLTAQDYLAATISMPNVAISPVTSFRPLPPSRSTSSTRKHGLYQAQLHHAFHAEGSTSNSAFPAPYPSPGLALSNNGFWNSAEDVTMPMTAPPQRPSTLRRTSSYGTYTLNAQYAGNSTDTYSFGDDAFAPLCQQPKMTYDKANPWAGFSGTSSAFGFGQKPAVVQERQEEQPRQDQAWNGNIANDGDDEMMDEDWAEHTVDEDDDENSVEEAMGLSAGQEEFEKSFGNWERGRRKELEYRG